MSNAINTDTYFSYNSKEAKSLIFCFMLIIRPCWSFSGCKSSHSKHLLKHSISKSASVLTLVRDCRLLFSNRAKQRPIPSISASDSSQFQFYIGFRSFRPETVNQPFPTWNNLNHSIFILNGSFFIVCDDDSSLARQGFRQLLQGFDLSFLSSL